MASNSQLDQFYISIGLDPSGFRQGMGELQQSMKRSRDEVVARSREIEEGAKKAGNAFFALRNEVVGLFAALVGAAGIKQFLENTARSEVALGSMTRQVGMSADELYTWGRMMEQAGSKGESFQQALAKIRTEVAAYYTAEAHLSGSGNIDIINRLNLAGINPQHIRDMGIQFADVEKIAKRLQTLASGPQGMAGAVSAGAALGFDELQTNALVKNANRLREAFKEVQAHGTIGQDDVERGERFSKALGEAAQSAQTLATQLGRPLQDASTGFLHELSKWLDSIRDAQTGMDKLKAAIKPAADVTEQIGNDVDFASTELSPEDVQKGIEFWKDKARGLQGWFRNWFQLPKGVGFGPPDMGDAEGDASETAGGRNLYKASGVPRPWGMMFLTPSHLRAGFLQRDREDNAALGLPGSATPDDRERILQIRRERERETRAARDWRSEHPQAPFGEMPPGAVGVPRRGGGGGVNTLSPELDRRLDAWGASRSQPAGTRSDPLFIRSADTADASSWLYSGMAGSAPARLQSWPGQVGAMARYAFEPGELGTGIRERVRNAAIKLGLDPNWMQALARAEGGNDPATGAPRTSPKGAYGTMQIWPPTGEMLRRQYGLDYRDPEQNIMLGSLYFRDLLKQFRGDYAAATAAYNAGPGGAGVQRLHATGDPSDLPPETQHYLRQIKRWSVPPAAMPANPARVSEATRPAPPPAPAGPVDNSSSSEMHIGQVTVNTQATDAQGISAGLGAALRRYAAVGMANYGMA